MNGLKTLACLGILTITLSGCATTPAPKNNQAVFFPPLPNPPRIQYLKSFAGAKDIVPDGSALDSFLAGKQNASGHLLKPYGTAMFDGKIYVCDSNATVMVFNLKEKSYGPLAGAQGLGKLVQPLNIFIDKDGTKYVTDPIRGQVVVFDRNDFYVKAYGMQGGWKPVDAAIFEDRLYVVDAQNKQIRVFNTKSGEWVKTIGDSGAPEEKLGLPTNIAFDAKGTIYISDTGRIQVLKYDRDGHFLGSVGEVGSGGGYFARPRGVTLDREGRLYVVDAAYDNVQIFGEEDQLLLFFGGSGHNPGDMALPAEVYVDYDHVDYFRELAAPDFELESLLVVTSQFGEQLVSIYGMGKKKGMEYPSAKELREQAIKRIEEWRKAQPVSEKKEEKTEEKS